MSSPSAESSATAGQPPTTWAPLKVGLFRALWLGALVSHIGPWMQTVGAQWLLVREPNAATLVSLVQTAQALPVLLLALPAGVVADSFDRRRLLVAVQVFQVAVALTLTVLTAAGRMTPALLLTLTFALGAGAAVQAPRLPGADPGPGAAADDPRRLGAGLDQRQPGAGGGAGTGRCHRRPDRCARRLRRERRLLRGVHPDPAVLASAGRRAGRGAVPPGAASRWPLRASLPRRTADPVALRHVRGAGQRAVGPPRRGGERASAPGRRRLRHHAGCAGRRLDRRRVPASPRPALPHQQPDGGGRDGPLRRRADRPGAGTHRLGGRAGTAPGGSGMDRRPVDAERVAPDVPARVGARAWPRDLPARAVRVHGRGGGDVGVRGPAPRAGVGVPGRGGPAGDRRGDGSGLAAAQRRRDEPGPCAVLAGAARDHRPRRAPGRGPRDADLHRPVAAPARVPRRHA